MASEALKATKAPARRQERTTGTRGGASSAGLDRGRTADVHEQAGNLAVQRLMAVGVIQPKLRVGSPNDPLEAEADRAADLVIQRKSCSCGGSCSSCRGEEEELYRKRLNDPLVGPGLLGLRGAGNLAIRDLLDGRSVGGDGAATAAPRIAPTVQRAPQPGAPAGDKSAEGDKDKKTAGLIVEDTAKDLTPGQMKRSEFLGQLESATCSAASDAMAGTIWSIAGCPYIKKWFGYYRGRSAKHIEQAAQKYSGAAGVKNAADYIPKIAARIGQGVKRWIESGGVIPEGVPENPPTGGDDSQPTPGIQPKASEGGAKVGADPAAVRSQLGRGQPLGGTLGSRMGSALGHDFSRVRVHTDATASRLSSSLNARAFTIGTDVAFNSGEYRPGTPVGDALIAHELAHVVQQQGARHTVSKLDPNSREYSKLEDSADRSAAHAVLSMWGQAKHGLKGIAGRAVPSLRTGLRLQACTRTVKRCPTGTRWAVVGKPTATGPVCVCVWRCLPPGVGFSMSGAGGGSSGPTITCANKDAWGRCPGEPLYETVDEGFTREDRGTVVGVGGHMSPLGGQAACGCLPLTIEGDSGGTEQVHAPLLPPGLDVTDLAGMGGGLKRSPKTGVPTTGKKGAAKPPSGPKKGAVVAPPKPKVKPTAPKVPKTKPAAPKTKVKVDSSGKMTHPENGRELVRKDGVVYYKTDKKGKKEGGVCFSCNPDYYEMKDGRWRQKPGAKLPGKSKPSKDVSYDSIKDRKPVKENPKVPATKLGLDTAALGKFGSYLKDPGAVERVRSKKTVDGIKGQLAEEVVNQIGLKEAADMKPKKKGTPVFLRGDEVTGPAPKTESAGSQNAQLTDGIIAETYTQGAKLKLHIHRVYESKAGSGAAKGLPGQAEWNYERIKEVGISIKTTLPDGTVGWHKFAPEDISMPPRGPLVHGFVPSDVKATKSKDATKVYTPRKLPGITEGELHDAALMIHRSNTITKAE